MNKENYKFFNHKECEYYPCHHMEKEKINCLFCFCPLYALGKDCGGNFTYIGDIKDCSNCLVCHKIENYDYIMSKFHEIIEITKIKGEK